MAFLSVPLPLADVSDISRVLSVFHRPHVGVIQAARQLLSNERAPLRQKLLADLLHTVSENIAAETRAEDPPWFEGAWELGLGSCWAWEGSPEPDTLGEAGFSFSSPNKGLPKLGACSFPAQGGWSQAAQDGGGCI